MKRKKTPKRSSYGSGIFCATVTAGFICLAICSLQEAGNRPILADIAPAAPATYDGPDTKAMDKLLDDIQFESLLRAVVYVESRGNPYAKSQKGAYGKFQLMEDTVRKPGFGVQYMRDWSPREQYRFARDYLKALLHYYHDDTRRALAAYNCGPGCVDRSHGAWPLETRNFVARVRRYAQN